MVHRYEVKDNKLVYGIWDNLEAKFVSFNVEDAKVLHSLYEDTAIKACNQMNAEHHQLEKSTAIMKAAGIKGDGVNLCNEFNFCDLWEVVEWVSTDDCNGIVTLAFYNWYDDACLYMLTQHEMQCAIVDKIHELMTEAGMI